MRTSWCLSCVCLEWLTWVPGSGRGKGLGKELIFPSSMSRWRITGPFCSPNTSKILLVLLENVCWVCSVYLSACNFGVMGGSYGSLMGETNCCTSVIDIVVSEVNARGRGERFSC